VFFKSPSQQAIRLQQISCKHKNGFWKFLEAKNFLVGQLSEKWNSRFLQQTLSAAA
jgi:hypothetical protein